MNTSNFFIKGIKKAKLYRISPLIRGARGVQTDKSKILKSDLSKNRKNQQGFSLIGVLTASLMGMVVTLGLTKMMFNINTEVTQIKTTAHRIDLLNQISSLFALDCQGVLSQSLSSNQLTELIKGGEGSNKAPVQFSSLKDGDGTEILNADDQSVVNAEKMKRMYNMEGHSRFQLKCKEKNSSGNPDCDCSTNSSTVCPPKAWILSLFTMSYKNNLPVYQEMYRQGLRIGYPAISPATGITTANRPSKFTCNFTKEDPEDKMVYDDTHCASEKGSNNVIVGHCAGANLDNDSSSNSFFGNYVGKNNTTGKHNSFFGHKAGEGGSGGLEGSNNSFFGSRAGLKNTKGSDNTFFGFRAGYNNTGDSNIEDQKNTFYGYKAGENNITGSNNLFLGSQAGAYRYNDNTGKEDNHLNIANTIYGITTDGNEDDNSRYLPDPTKPGIRIYGSLEVCPDPDDLSSCVQINPSSTADLKGQSGSSKLAKNIVPHSKLIKGTSELGKLSKNFVPTSSSVKEQSGLRKLAKNTALPEGHRHPAPFRIAPGNPQSHESGNPEYPDFSNKTRIIRGAGGFKAFLNKTSSSLRKEYVSDLVFYNSSREYKQNLVPFRDYEKALELLLTTPLFSYQYKDDYPEKERMGVIAEELPASLQLPTDPVQPDWLSIYGYLWAGIKALHKELQDVKEQALKQKELCEFNLYGSCFKNSGFISNLNPPRPPLSGGNSISIQSLSREMDQLETAFKDFEAKNPGQNGIQTYRQSMEELEQEVAQLKKQEELFQQELRKIKQQIQN